MNIVKISTKIAKIRNLFPKGKTQYLKIQKETNQITFTHGQRKKKGQIRLQNFPNICDIFKPTGK